MYALRASLKEWHTDVSLLDEVSALTEKRKWNGGCCYEFIRPRCPEQP
jgi:hypothetical protein